MNKYKCTTFATSFIIIAFLSRCLLACMYIFLTINPSHPQARISYTPYNKINFILEANTYAKRE